jgi:hypothetical protein
MTTSAKISTCVDCGLSLLGEQLRCPACHATVQQPQPQHDDATPQDGLLPNFLVRWIVTVEILGIIGLALILMVRGCL